MEGANNLSAVDNSKLIAPEMQDAEVKNHFGYNTTRIYSPIILNNEWSSLWRLILVVLLIIAGNMSTGFYVSSFFIQKQLRKLGNVFLACLGMSDLFITAGVMPVVAVVMISKRWETASVCYALQFLAQAATYSYSLFFMMVSIERYIRLCRTRACHARFLRINVGLVSDMIFIISFATSAVGVYRGMDYDYCTRESYGNYIFRFITSLLFHGLPCLVTISFFFYTSLVLRARVLRLIHYKRAKKYQRDYDFTNLNMGCYIFFVISWLPYLFIVNKYPATADSNFYWCVWLGLSRSIVTSLLYSILNRNFRRAFGRLFKYCCLKIAIVEQFNNRRRRMNNNRENVHVHILHHSVPLDSNHAGTPAEIEVATLPGQEVSTVVAQVESSPSSVTSRCSNR